MCGICGIIASEPHLLEGREPTVKAMMDSIRHRGPTGEGLHRGEQALLGSRRLAIIDIDLGNQPIHSKDGRYTLVFNGEIYNYLELRQDLTRKGISFSTFSDTEVLLQILIHQGAKALNLLNGMFAFMLFDNMTQEWLAARDPLGIKPFYYSRVGDEFVFASEIKALFKHPHIHPHQNWDALSDYLTFQFTLDEQTLFKDIYKLMPGHYMTGQGGQIQQIQRYWDTNYTIDDYHTEDYFVDRLRYLLEDSIRLQIRSDVPLGTYLSGGIDSSVVSVLTADNLSNPLKAFHGFFPEGAAYDESVYARFISEKSQFELLTIGLNADQFIEDMPMLMYLMDEPVAGPGLFPQYRVSQLASQEVTVILGGQGGDEIFGGYARYLIAYLEQAIKGAIFENNEEGKYIVTLDSIIPNLPMLKQYVPTMKQFWRDGLFDSMDQRYYRLLDRSPDIGDILSEDAARQINQTKVFELFQTIFNHPDTQSYINKMTHFDIKTLLPALLHVEDRVSMAVSLESRVPLLDTRLVDIATTIPPMLKFQGGKSKYIFKQAVKMRLPQEVLNRKDKMGFPVPLDKWLKESPQFKDFIHSTLLGTASRTRGLFKLDKVEHLLNGQGLSSRQLWGMLCLELWSQQFFDAT